ncbi:hypothetical protein PVAND_004071 [Polypedilum vanderplanki]|uniref:Uncharacterized protein n=1 Tax=Polypedilum vanderplanki TaxID=319348 RepID=A0A9J6BW21_POLVA|nr:hypothetical protein PVAND_004071 [Polypedilum vanderplanki]
MRLSTPICQTESDGELRCWRNLIWYPFYCVLQQEEQTFTAYCSEELSLADVFFAELPRIRIDGRSNDARPRSRKTIWEPTPSTIHEEAEDEMVFNSSNIELNTALQNCLGKFLYHAGLRPNFFFSVTSLNGGSQCAISMQIFFYLEQHNEFR